MIWKLYLTFSVSFFDPILTTSRDKMGLTVAREGVLPWKLHCTSTENHYFQLSFQYTLSRKSQRVFKTPVKSK